MLETRSREIINCHQIEPESQKNVEAIHRFTQLDPDTNEEVEMIDLDNSVFMNFKRYTKEDVGAAFKADKDFFDFDEIVEELEDA